MRQSRTCKYTVRQQALFLIVSKWDVYLLLDLKRLSLESVKSDCNKIVSDTEYRCYFVHFFLSVSCFCARNKTIRIASCMFIHVWNWRRIERISESSFRSCLVIWFTVWGVSYASIFSGDGTQCFAVYSTVIDRKFFTPPPHTHTHARTLGALDRSKKLSEAVTF